MNGFKLQMNQRRLHQRRQGLRVIVNKLLQLRQQGGHPLGRRRHKDRVAGARAANPVLRATQPTGLLARTDSPKVV